LGSTIDLSKILFIATANRLDSIPYPLLNRMTCIEIDAYSVRQKIEIAQGYIIPQLMTEYGLSSVPFMTTELIKEVILHYTAEAGVRSLTRKLKTLIARYVRGTETGNNVYITPEALPLYLGAPRERDPMPNENKVGLVNGLSYSGVGGDLITVEVQTYPGKGKVKMTGLGGEMLKESIEQVMSFIKTNIKALTQLYGTTTIPDLNTLDVHIQVRPMQVEGPSAGLAFCTGVVSALFGRPFNHEYAMTGEIDIFGAAHAIGGINQKFEGARRNGIKYIILPEENRADFDVLREKPAGIEFFFVKHVNEVLARVLLPAA
jgi:ATP-dependent Lon protease